MTALEVAIDAVLPATRLERAAGVLFLRCLRRTARGRMAFAMLSCTNDFASFAVARIPLNWMLFLVFRLLRRHECFFPELRDPAH